MRTPRFEVKKKVSQRLNAKPAACRHWIKSKLFLQSALAISQTDSTSLHTFLLRDSVGFVPSLCLEGKRQMLSMLPC